MTYQSGFPGLPSQVVLARALYDNRAEFPNELSFKRMDVVTVLEKDSGGNTGWWLCSLNGRIGVVPGNRFEVLGVVERKLRGERKDEYDNPVDWPQNDSQMEKADAVYNETDPATTTTPGRDSLLTDSGNCSTGSSDFSAKAVYNCIQRDGQTISESPIDDGGFLDIVNKLEPTASSTPRASICVDLLPTSNKSEEPSRCGVLSDLQSPQIQQLDVHTPSLSGEHGCDPIKRSRTSMADEIISKSIQGPPRCSNQQHRLTKNGFIRLLSPMKDRWKCYACQPSVVDFSYTDAAIARFDANAWKRIRSDDLASLMDLTEQLVRISVSTGDSGLIRRFQTFNKFFNHASSRMDWILEEMTPPDIKPTSRRIELIRKLENLMKFIKQCLLALEATALANATMLFCHSNEQAHHLPVSSQSTNDLTYRPCETRQMNSTASKHEHLTADTINRLIKPLVDSCVTCLDAIDCVSNWLNSRMLSKRCINSEDIQQTTDRVKSVMLHCTSLIRCLADVRNTLANDIGSTTEDPCATIVCTLERKGNNICETLKSLVILTKEVNAHCSESATQFTIPGPLLQRLHGASISVRNALRGLHEILDKLGEPAQNMD